MISQAPGWKRAADARASAEQVAASLRDRGFAVDEPLLGELQTGPVMCVVARPA